MDRGKIDLHLHSTASDGTWTPLEAVQAAKAAGLAMMALTDHDSVANVVEAETYAQEAGIKYLRGVEICTTENGHCYHVLSYGLDITNKGLQELLAYNNYLLEQKDENSIQKLVDLGWPVSLEEFRHYSYDRRRGGWRSLAYLEDKNLCKDIKDFFARIFTEENGLCFPTFGGIKETIDLIHNAGGVAILAHAASDFHGPGLEETLAELGAYAFDGFECYHTGHSAEDTAKLVEYCRQHHLMRTGGSDCHGALVASRVIGEPTIYAENIFLPGLV